MKKKHFYRNYFEAEGHRLDFDSVKIVPTENLGSSRKFMEGVHTKITNYVINRVVNIPGCFFGGGPKFRSKKLGKDKITNVLIQTLLCIER